MSLPGGSVVKNLPGDVIQSLGCEDPLEKEMVTHSSILAWEIPWIEEPGGLQFMGSQRVRHDLVTKQHHTALCLLTTLFQQTDSHLDQDLSLYS